MTAVLDPVVSGRGLTRRYGTFTAVDNVDVSVGSGEIVGLLGANGAGKTTLIRMLLGLLKPTGGTVALMGGPPSRHTRRLLGYVPQGLGLYTDLTVAQNHRFHASAFHTSPETAALSDLDGRTLVGDLSLGQQRRLAFELAAAHDPRLLVLDEPTSGVGPLGRTRLWDRIHARADSGTGVLVTTHHLSEAEQCDRLVMMAAGRVVARGTAPQIIGDAKVVDVTTDDQGRVLTALGDAGMVASLGAGGVAVPGVDMEKVRTVLANSSAVDDIGVRPATLEERFVELASPVSAPG